MSDENRTQDGRIGGASEASDAQKKDGSKAKAKKSPRAENPAET